MNCQCDLHSGGDAMDCGRHLNEVKPFGIVNPAKHVMEIIHLLTEQNPILVPDTGCVLVATVKLDGVRSFEGIVVLLLRYGIWRILNRTTIE